MISMNINILECQLSRTVDYLQQLSLVYYPHNHL